MSDPRSGAVAMATLQLSGVEDGPLHADLAERIDEYLQAQRSGARTAPPAELPTMGSTHDDVLADPVVADYCRTFAIRPERSRLTGT